jgi:hypothetical protein
MLVQRDIGKLVQYTSDMGGGAELLEVALRIPPWEPMRALSRDELRRTRLDTSVLDRAGSNVPVSSGTAVDVRSGGETIRADVGDRGWIMADRGGRAVLSRRHPLTLEGERIGSFELTVSCGANADSFAVGYSESRRGDGEAALKRVDLWIDGQANPLDVVSSRPGAAARELDSLAAGTVASALLKSFADAPAESLTVRTLGNTNPGTLIRVGNSGFGRALPRLAAACKAAAPAATEARMMLDLGDAGRR